MSNKVRYDYFDEQHNLLYTKVRVTDPKSFYWERVVDGKVVRDRSGCRKIFYRLPELMYGLQKKLPVFLVEGEKDVLTLLSRACIATTTTGALEWTDSYTELLKDAEVILLYDNDRTGCQRRDLICKKLYGKVKSLKVVDLGFEYSASHGKDITDWFDQGHQVSELKKLIKKTPEYIPPDEIRSINIYDMLRLDIPPRDMLLDPIIPQQGLMLLAAKRGVGKTHIALGIAYAVSNGGRFLNWKAPEPRKVVYVDGEMPASLMQERLQLVTSMSDKPQIMDNFRLITPDLQAKALPDLATEEGRKKIEPLFKDADLIVLDNLSTLFRSGGENDVESWQDAQAWALKLRRTGKSIIFVHHMGKAGTQRGTSKREDALDTVILLKHPEDYNAEQGARFEVHFDKARHFTGGAARSFEVQLRTYENKSWWELQ